MGVSFVAVLTALAVVAMIALPAAVQAQPSAPAPAPTSDGTSIDQGIAYVLMLVALALTYLIHAADLCFTF
ncbi:Arabinogalactan peptide 20 [Hibiscus syriacus]|uniref:Arabinogalactan peptide 20 n=1 Tax=Hibiscus syriacus TaxID=106335 RepID=A0A6A2YWQ3_HIBSY|nr:Arabinogalactan peptide 20 [Hibiscus syriacus]